MIKDKNIGDALDDFLADQGLLEATEEQAIKEILADQVREAMEKEGLTKVAMARRMNTSRRALDRLLDPTHPGVTLHTMLSAASAVGRRLRIELV